MRHFGTTSRRLVAGFAAVALVLGLAVFLTRGGPDHGHAALKSAPGPGEVDSLEAVDRYWKTRITYPTGRFDERWLTSAAKDDQTVAVGLPAGLNAYRARTSAPLALSATSFTPLGPQPENSDTCLPLCYKFGLVSGRVNSIAIDPTTTTPGLITAYFAADGGGVWKTTNCCTAATTWAVTTDGPLISTTSVDDLTIDPANHNTIYAATGDLTFGSFSFGSVGILKSTNGGGSWTVLGSNVFTPVYPPDLTPTYPQYQAVGKVRVDPNNSNIVVAGTKTGLYFSYDAGSNWTGPCLTNSYTTQRQDITGLIMRDDGATTTMIAAVGTRGYATAVQPDLGNNGANGIYSATVPASGCPAGWTLLSTPANGWPQGTGGGIGCQPVGTTDCLATANKLGRIDLAIAPSDPHVMYAEVQAVNVQSTCGARGCFLGLWKTTDSGATWTKGADNNTLHNDTCGDDTAQNWYNQALAVDPTDPNTLIVDILDIWKSTDGGATLTDVTCGYTLGLAVAPEHVDQHALAYAPPVAGVASTLLAGSDGGIYVSNNANAAVQQPTSLLPGVPTFQEINTTVSTIEQYSGDISANFATSNTPAIAAGAQDNGSSAYQWAGANTQGPAVWQTMLGGDGFYARIEQKSGQRVFMESQWGGMARSTTGVYGSYGSPSTPWGAGSSTSPDRKSFIFPYEIDKFDCTTNNPSSTCDHMIAGSYRIYESVNGATSWVINSGDLTKGTLADRSFINALNYAYTTNTIGIAGTNDGNVQYGFGLGQGTAGSAAWVDVTGGNAVLPNRPILDVVISPDPADSGLVGYASVGGFDQNTLSTPGHVFKVTCTASCATFTWQDKTGNLPNIPADSIIVNPHVPKQVFVGTDWGLYFTNDISVASPVWYRFQNGLPNTMIWDMAIDRGATTLAVFTRGRGAFAWPLPTSNLPTAVRLVSFGAAPTRQGVAVTWRTVTEAGTIGYDVWRFSAGKAVKVNRGLIVAKTSGIGRASYRVVDRGARSGQAYTYRLRALGLDGKRAWVARTAIVQGGGSTR
jgi:hypothetical protein